MLQNKARKPGVDASAGRWGRQRPTVWQSFAVRASLWLVIALEFAAIFYISSHY